MSIRIPSWGMLVGVSCVVAASLALAEDATPKGSTPGVLFSSALSDVPGKHLVVVGLNWGPDTGKHSMPHRHPGSVYVYVTKGTVKLGIEGEPVRIVHAGESFFEPVGALHTVAENVSTTEPAAAIAVMIVPDGAPLVTPDTAAKKSAQ